MQRYLFIIVLLFFSFPLLTQTLQIEASYTYIWDVNSFDKELRYGESTINSNINVGFNRHKLGLQILKIYTKGSTFRYDLLNENNDYLLLGLFYQYNLFNSKKYKFFPEVSVNYGNYCTCGDADPYKLDNLIYLGFGLGLDINVYKNLFVLTGFHSYQPVSSSIKEISYAYTQYVLGLGLRFGE